MVDTWQRVSKKKKESSVKSMVFSESCSDRTTKNNKPPPSSVPNPQCVNFHSSCICELRSKYSNETWT
jgi:hypothetical protein